MGGLVLARRRETWSGGVDAAGPCPSPKLRPVSKWLICLL